MVTQAQLLQRNLQQQVQARQKQQLEAQRQAGIRAQQEAQAKAQAKAQVKPQQVIAPVETAYSKALAYIDFTSRGKPTSGTPVEIRRLADKILKENPEIKKAMQTGIAGRILAQSKGLDLWNI